MTTAAFPQPTTSTRAAAPPRAESLQGRGRWGTREWTMLRWAVRATLFLGVAASVAANVLHAQPNPISQAIAAWPPLALLFTVELIARVPIHRRGLAAARLLAATTIAAIAAFVSYWHMVGVAARYGETGASPYLLPLSVDGLIIVASISLVEISGRLRTIRPDQPVSLAGVAPPPAIPAAPGTDTIHQPAVPDADTASPAAPPPAEAVPAVSLAAVAPAVAAVPLTEPGRQPTDAHQSADAPLPGEEPPSGDGADAEPPARSRPVVPDPPTPPQPADAADPHHEVPAAPREAIAYWQRRLPGIGIEDLAERIGKSPRQIRRYLRQPAGNAAKRVNGQRNDTVAGTFRSPSP